MGIKGSGVKCGFHAVGVWGDLGFVSLWVLAYPHSLSFAGG